MEQSGPSQKLLVEHLEAFLTRCLIWHLINENGTTRPHVYSWARQLQGGGIGLGSVKFTPVRLKAVPVPRANMGWGEERAAEHN